MPAPIESPDMLMAEWKLPNGQSMVRIMVTSSAGVQDQVEKPSLRDSSGPPPGSIAPAVAIEAVVTEMELAMVWPWLRLILRTCAIKRPAAAS